MHEGLLKEEILGEQIERIFLFSESGHSFRYSCIYDLIFICLNIKKWKKTKKEEKLGENLNANTLCKHKCVSCAHTEETL